MGITVNQIVMSEQESDLCLKAGRIGLNRWVVGCICLTQEHLTKSQGRDHLIIVSDEVFVQGQTLIEIIRDSNHVHASGIILCSDHADFVINQSVVLLCNKLSLPIFVMSESGHTITLKQQLNSLIVSLQTKEQQDKEDMIDLLNEEKNGNLITAFHTEPFSFTKDGYRVVVVSVCDREYKDSLHFFYHKIPIERTKMLAQAWERILNTHQSPSISFYYEGYIVSIFKSMPLIQTKEILSDAIHSLQLLLNEDEAVFCYAGKHNTYIEHLYQSFSAAVNGLLFAQISCEESTIHFEEAMGIERLLFSISDTEVLDSFYQETIGILEAYDIANATNLVSVMESYFRNNGNIYDTALEYRVHKQTIQAKLSKIESLLHVDTTSFMDRARLVVGLSIAKIRTIHSLSDHPDT